MSGIIAPSLNGFCDVGEGIVFEADRPNAASFRLWPRSRRRCVELIVASPDVEELESQRLIELGAEPLM